VKEEFSVLTMLVTSGYFLCRVYSLSTTLLNLKLSRYTPRRRLGGEEV
jgi:hypothetical protein